MKKILIILLLAMSCGSAWSGQVGLPEEQVALPAVQGNYLVCVWDETARQWLQAHQTYDHTGSYSFQLPSWGKWYWVGLWDESLGEYVFGKWVGHFMTH